MRRHSHPIQIVIYKAARRLGFNGARAAMVWSILPSLLLLGSRTAVLARRTGGSAPPPIALHPHLQRYGARLSGVRNGAPMGPRPSDGYAHWRRTGVMPLIGGGALDPVIPVSGTPGPGYWDDAMEILGRVRNRVVDVADYGADPTNTNDSTSAIQDAIDSLSAAGGIVWFGPGTYKLVSGLTFPFQQVHLRGAGYDNTFLRYTGTGVALAFGDGVTHYDWGSIEDMEIKSTQNADLTLVSLNGAHRGWIKGCFLRGSGVGTGSSRCLHLQSSYQNYFEDSIIASCARAADLDGVNHDTSFKDVSLAAPTCLRVKNSHNVRVSGGQISDATDAAVRVLGTDPSNLCHGFELRNVHFEGNTLDAIFGDAAESTSVIPSPTIVGCPLPNGIELDKCDRPVIVGAHLGGYVAGTKITITANCTEAILIGCYETSGTMITDAGVRTLRIDNGKFKVYDGGTLLQYMDKDGLRLANGKDVSFKDSGGVLRRGLLLTGGNVWDAGDIDSQGHVFQLFGGGGVQATLDEDGVMVQGASHISSGSGAPNNANGVNGDYYFNKTGGVGTRIYFKTGGAWTGIL